ncbi:MAG: tyrosine--tRNA ligase [Gammaproteobacteria bacterium]|nr:tyrosine--tRNA ligase [Gammaproteobacteria bacterium]MDE0257281.1 tyrosine--tRNA ligase [Gammaproteobacteria bacterium]
MNLLDEYTWRGLLYDATDGAAQAFASRPRVAYIGFDPTASSLHVGSLLPIMGLVHLQRAGHTPVALVGGGTGLIGDPSEKAAERALLSKEEAEANAAGIHSQLAHFLDFEVRGNPARMANNLDWLGRVGMVDFLRDVGKHFSINALLGKDSIRRRVQDPEASISFTEFSYVLLQAYDFLELHDRMGCTVQMGGSDQWGNITAGIELIRRVRGARAYGVTFPLLTTSSGTKFGKTESGTVWLDPARTTPYRFYQFWMNTPDADAGAYLRLFTLFPREEVEELEASIAAEPHRRLAQKALAADVTRRLHGEDGLGRARKASEVLFGGEVEGLDAAEIADIFADVPSSRISAGDVASTGLPLVDLLHRSGLAISKSDARRAIAGGGVYLNNRRVAEASARVAPDDTLHGEFVVLRRGKKRYHLVRVIGP